MSSLSAQSPAVLNAFGAKMFTTSTSFNLPYRIWEPTLKEGEKLPLLLFLHGAGERGNDNIAQMTHGAAMLLQKSADFPAWIVMPQCAQDDYWAQMEKDSLNNRVFNFNQRPNPSLAAVMELLDSLLATGLVDTNRVYLMGLSMGGMGTFELLARRPDTFAAAAPICGGTNPALLPLYAHKVPLWIFHGAEDQVVFPSYSRAVVQQMQALGVPVKYTEYLGVNHNSWDNAFAEPELMEWMFSHSK
ncbi:MAG: prolyl oligopeptidase family serine peptidase [Saprospiraceae bacterium]